MKAIVLYAEPKTTETASEIIVGNQWKTIEFSTFKAAIEHCESIKNCVGSYVGILENGELLLFLYSLNFNLDFLPVDEESAIVKHFKQAFNLPIA